MMWANAGRFVRGSEQPCRAETYPSSDESGTGDDNVDDTSEGFATEESFAVAESSENEETNGDSNSSEETNGHSTSAEQRPSSLLLTRRSASFGVTEDGDINFADHDHRCENSRDISALQNLWFEHASEAGSLYPRALWSILKAVIVVPKVTQSKVLEVTNNPTD